MAEQTPTVPVGHIWGIPVREGKPAEITRPDGSAIVVPDGIHVLSIPGEYLARVGRTTHKVVAVHDDPS